MKSYWETKNYHHAQSSYKNTNGNWVVNNEQKLIECLEDTFQSKGGDDLEKWDVIH